MLVSNWNLDGGVDCFRLELESVRERYLTKTKAVRSSLQIDVEEKDLSGLLLAGCAVEADQKGHGQRVGRHKHVEPAHELAQRHVIRITLPVEPDRR